MVILQVPGFVYLAFAFYFIGYWDRDQSADYRHVHVRGRWIILIALFWVICLPIIMWREDHAETR